MERKTRILQVASRFGKSWEELGLVIVHSEWSNITLYKASLVPPKDRQHKIKTESKFKHHQTCFHQFLKRCVLSVGLIINPFTIPIVSTSPSSF